MRSAAEQPTIVAPPTRPYARPQPGTVALRRLLSALALGGLLAACSSTTIHTHLSTPSNDQPRYSLGGRSGLLVSSPDLNRRWAAQHPSLLDFTSSRDRAGSTTELPDILKIELSTPEQKQRSKLLLHFAEEGGLLDRASLYSNLRLKTWLLAFKANLSPSPGDTVGPSFHLQSEFSGLFGERHSYPPHRSTAPLPNTSGIRNTAASVQDPQRPGRNNPISKLALGPNTPASKRYYLAFHDASLATDENGKLNFLFSIGGYPGGNYGEVVTTYRLLSMDQEGGDRREERGSLEQAVAIGYTGHFSSWFKSFGHTLTYFNYRSTGGETLEQLDLSTAGSDTDYRKWQSRVELSGGEELRGPGQGILKGYRFDAHLETQAALERSGLLPAARKSAATWGSQLRLKTDFGTFSGKLSRSPSQHRLGFALQKTGLTGARLRLYYEDIDHRSLGALETRVGGQVKLPLDETLLRVLTPAYWKASEAELFAARPPQGYTAPRQGRHVPTLNNDTPGMLQ